MNVALEFHDSTVDRVEKAPGSICVRFAPGYFHHSLGIPGVDSGLGYLQPATLRFSGAQSSALSDECAGTLWDGLLKVDGRPYELLPVPFDMSGAIQAEFRFNTGATLAITARSATLRLEGEPVFLDRFDA